MGDSGNSHAWAILPPNYTMKASCSLLLLSALVLGAYALPTTDDIVPETTREIFDVHEPSSAMDLVETSAGSSDWKPGEPYDKDLDSLREWPATTCWREKYNKEEKDRRRKKSDGSACDAGYVSVGKKTCRATCPEDWVTCGIREDRGLMCGQSRKDCAEAKWVMVKSVTEAVMNVAAMVFTAGTATGVMMAMKAVQLMLDTMDFIETIYKFMTGTPKEQLYMMLPEDAQERISEAKKWIDLIKKMKTSDPPQESDESYPYRRRVLAIVGKFLGQELLAVVDTIGVTDVVKAFAKPKCHSPNFYWFLTEPEEPPMPTGAYNISHDVSISKKPEGCDSTDTQTCGDKEKDQALVDSCQRACDADPECVGFEFKEGSKGGQMKNGMALGCYEHDKKMFWYEKFTGDK